MDKNAIKNYAVWARREMIARVSQRALIYGITAENVGAPNVESVNGRLLSQTEKQQRQALIRRIKEKGFEQVMEEVAYTWFNRFAALRFMEVNGYLPSHVRVFTNDAGEFKPQILAEAIHLELEGLDMNTVYELENADKRDELFKYLLIVQCNALNSILPGMFQKIDDYTELLLPDNLLRDGSVVERLISDIPEDNFDVKSENGNGQIEIIGWLYQYYISEKHEEVVDPLHGKVVKKEEVPAATQLFTTDWVVRYLIDNSVGRYWIERNPNSTLADKLTYFIKPKQGGLKTVNESITPQELTTFDPCVGSGHFLVYAFDVLIKIYIEYGYSEREAACEIITNNLYGLDIDGRAVQLAYFAVMMKARQYDRRFFTRGIQPHIYEILESNTADKASLEHFYGKDTVLKKDIEALVNALKDAKEYGSILQMPTVDFKRINKRFEQLHDEISIYNTYLFGEFHLLLMAAEIISGKYAVVVTNPPYLNKYDVKLKDYIFTNYADYKGDLFSIFMYRNFLLCKNGGYTGFMTPMVWMFIQTYETLRRYILHNKGISTLIQMEYSAYEEATVPVCTFVLRNYRSSENGYYFKLSEFTGGMDVQRDKVVEGLNNEDCDYFYETSQSNFDDVPGTPIAFWINPHWFKAFCKYPMMRDVCVLKKGTSTGDNKRFIRQWQEVDNTKTCFVAHTPKEAVLSKRKWFPINGGGERRKWYGNRFDVVNWEADGAEMKALATKLNHGGHWSRYIINPDRFFTEAIGWSAISSSRISVRYVGFGFAFSSAAMEAFEADLKYILALINSIVAEDILKLLAPTINFGVEQIGRIPFIKKYVSDVEKITDKCIELSQNDWDSFETSWDFQRHPLLPPLEDEEEESLSNE
ncbi:MAG: BREX-1 system adenine-specific DNA-methyltransferase PglX [Victivallales bacterium]|nr:BREX-1 system adenine-specific DNA-methyltransferase PglX [Victivallales bacterium]